MLHCACPQIHTSHYSPILISGTSTITLSRGQSIIGIHFLPGVTFSVTAKNNGPGKALVNIRVGNLLNFNLEPHEGGTSSVTNIANPTPSNSVVDIVAPNRDTEIVVTLEMV